MPPMAMHVSYVHHGCRHFGSSQTFDLSLPPTLLFAKWYLGVWEVFSFCSQFGKFGLVWTKTCCRHQMKAGLGGVVGLIFVHSAWAFVLGSYTRWGTEMVPYNALVGFLITCGVLVRSSCMRWGTTVLY